MILTVVAVDAQDAQELADEGKLFRVETDPYRPAVAGGLGLAPAVGAIDGAAARTTEDRSAPDPVLPGIARLLSGEGLRAITENDRLGVVLETLSRLGQTGCQYEAERPAQGEFRKRGHGFTP